MSRSNPTTENVSIPVKSWFEWAGGKDGGYLKYYNGEKNVQVKPPFKFLVLDIRSSVTGWDDNSESGIYANHVKFLNEEALSVRSFKGGELVSGLYKDIKSDIINRGGKYCKSVFIAYMDSDTNRFEIGNLQLKGSAAHAWTEFSNDNKGRLYDDAVVLDGSKDGKKGSIKYKTPTFSLSNATDEDGATASELDKQLQAYFKVESSKSEFAENPEQEDVSTASPEVELDDLPF
jgi:hypothetical protein